MEFEGLKTVLEKNMKYYRKMIGEKCYLSPVSLDDAEQYCIWLNDEDVFRTLNISDSTLTLHDEKNILEKISKKHMYGIIDIATDKLIGSCGLHNLDQRNQNCEIGIFIGDKSMWNKGYGSEALKLLADYAFKYLNMHNIMLEVYSYNKGAVKCYEKTGFKIVGIRREALVRFGKKYDEILMDLLPEDLYKNFKGDSDNEK